MPRKNGNEKMVIISVHVPPRMLEMLDRLVEAGYYANRSEAIRAALSEFLAKWAPTQKREEERREEEPEVQLLDAR